MINRRSEINFYVDALIVETLLSNDNLRKNAQLAGIASQITSAVKNYIGAHFDTKEPVKSLTNILAPSAIFGVFSMMGLSGLGIILGICYSKFHWDISGIVTSICDGIKSVISTGTQMFSDQIQGIVTEAIDQHIPDIPKTSSTNIQQLRQAKLLKLAMNNYVNNEDIVKMAAVTPLIAKTLLSRVLGWVFTVLIWSTGFMLAGDAINHFLGRPNAFDGTLNPDTSNSASTEQNQETSAPSRPVHNSTQTKFKPQSDYHEENKNVSTNWAESIPNDLSAIGDMLVIFAKQVYQGLDGLESVIKMTHGFQVIRDKIYAYNSSQAGAQEVYIPRYFTSKKQMVDFFIDDVASATPAATNTTH
jgi:hypothetical protein